MADASIDIRIFPNKELLSADMAELMDASIFDTGVIQGCQIQEINGVLNVSSGRLVVGGRLGVVSGGTIPLPSLSQQETCYLLAICDLQNHDRPFYFSLATLETIEQMGIQIDSPVSANFNAENGIGAATLGYCTVNPATGLVSGWTAMPQATARKGLDWYNEVIDKIDEVSDRVTNLEQIKTLHVTRTITLPGGSASNPSVTNVDFGNDLPAGTKLAGAVVKLGNFQLPYLDYNSGAVNAWVSHINDRSLVIRNRTSSVWNNYEMSAVIFYFVDPNANN